MLANRVAAMAAGVPSIPVYEEDIPVLVRVGEPGRHEDTQETLHFKVVVTGLPDAPQFVQVRSLRYIMLKVFTS